MSQKQTSEPTVRKQLEERVETIRRELPGDAEPLFAAVYCNGCGRIEGAATIALLLPLIEGWEIGLQFGGQDYCPTCREEGDGWAGSFPRRRTG